MMKKILIFLLLGLFKAKAQQIVLDPGHLAIVNENGFVRLASEMSHHDMLENIADRLDDVKINLSAVILTEQIVYRSLSEVNNALKDSRSVLQIASLSAQIFSLTEEILSSAKSAPYLLLFAELSCRQAKDRGAKLVLEVSNLCLKEQQGLLLNHEKRDALLEKISLELKVISALLYSVKKCMYWAKVNGLLQSVNPFSTFINTDKRLAEDILNKIKTLKP